ncbi:MAG TPA: MBL fold metallo-hydrolase [Candidatus Limnocylindria bacterium]|jgi:glyoxylase-like metal-dependent hydrolase (beta-lactamase superfamily II)
MKIATGIHRLGGGLVNAYLVEEGGEITIVDAGAPGYWSDLPDELAAMDRSLADVRALVLTHAHVDHIGFAERLRSERRVPVSVHELDAKMARGEAKPQNQKILGIGLFALIGFIRFGLAKGLLRSTPIHEVSPFGDGATLDVPGAPRVIHVPGHSEGSAALHFSGRDALFVGDAFATLNVISGKIGPQLAPFGSDLERARESLARLERVEAGTVLPGHGQPWTKGVGEAIRLIRGGAPH